MQTEKSLRYAAIQSAKHAITDKAKNEPVKFMDGLLKNPYLLNGIGNMEEIFDILISQGMHDKLMLLATSGSLNARASTILASKLL